MSTGPSSLEKAFRGVAEDGGALLGVNVEANQLDLLRDPETGKLPSNVFQLARAERGRGRPPGAGNKRNQKLAKLICSQHGDPVLFMASVYSMPLDQLVELLRIADNADEREERLALLVDKVESEVLAICGRGALQPGQMRELVGLVDKLGDIAKVLRATPGKLALDALVVKLQAAKATAEYVHGKQPVSIEVKGKADLVVFAPELLKQHDIDPVELENAIAKRGLEAFDLENMQLLSAPEADEAEFEEVEEGGDADI